MRGSTLPGGFHRSKYMRVLSNADGFIVNLPKSRTITGTYTSFYRAETNAVLWGASWEVSPLEILAYVV